MKVLLRDLAPGQEYAVKFRSNTGESASEWSHVQKFTATNDTIAPSQPTNVSWYDSGTAFIGEWDKVTTQATSPVSALKDFRHYRCNISDGVKSVDRFVLREYISFSKEDNIAAFGSFKNALTLKVYAVDNTSNESVAGTAVVNPANPPVPSAPVLKPYYGSLMAEWNGKDASGATMPTNLDYLEVHLSTTSNFTPTASTLYTRLYPNLSAITQRALLSGLTDGTTYYARFVAVNLANKKSNPSVASTSAQQARLSGLDIQPNGIGTDQINFTARDLGGANAFYGTTQPRVGVNGVTTIKPGDIWYDTNTGAGGGKTYRYDGATWVEDPTIGVISGSKILTNTLTADAVGTNLLITSTANVGVATIDSASITYLDAAKITTGVLQSNFMVNYGGVLQPAFSIDMNGNATLNNIAIKGQAVVGSAGNTATQNASFAVRSYNYVKDASGWTINGDGSVEFGNATIRGVYKTATFGRRIEMGSSGSVGILQFFNPSNVTQWIRSLPNSNNNNMEELQFRGGDQSLIQSTSDGTLALWGLGRYDTFNSVWMVQQGGTNLVDNRKTRLQINTTASGFRYFTTGGQELLRLDDTTGMSVFNAAGNNLFQVNITQGATALRHPSASGYSMTYNNDGGGHFYFNTGDRGWIQFNTGLGNDATPNIRFFSASGYGIQIRGAATSSYHFLDCLRWDANDWTTVRASAFTVMSDAELKSVTRDVSIDDAYKDVMGMKLRRYYRKYEQNGQVKYRAREEVGFVAQEMPSRVVYESGDGASVDLYQTLALAVGSIQKLANEVTTLRTELNNIRGKGK